jgi:hypothetical protein
LESVTEEERLVDGGFLLVRQGVWRVGVGRRRAGESLAGRMSIAMRKIAAFVAISLAASAEPDYAELMRRLGDENATVRAAAREELLQLTYLEAPRLEALASKSEDPEVAAALQSIAGELRERRLARLAEVLQLQWEDGEQQAFDHFVSLGEDAFGVLAVAWRDRPRVEEVPENMSVKWATWVYYFLDAVPDWHRVFVGNGAGSRDEIADGFDRLRGKTPQEVFESGLRERGDPSSPAGLARVLLADAVSVLDDPDAWREFVRAWRAFRGKELAPALAALSVEELDRLCPLTPEGARAVQALAIFSGEPPVERVMPFLSAEDPRVILEAAIGLLRRGRREGLDACRQLAMSQSRKDIHLWQRVHEFFYTFPDDAFAPAEKKPGDRQKYFDDWFRDSAAYEWDPAASRWSAPK